MYEQRGGNVSVTPHYPPASYAAVATPEEARTYDTHMARWYFTVNAPSPSKPFGRYR